MARTGVQAQSPTLTVVPSENVKGFKAERRVLSDDYLRSVGNLRVSEIQWAFLRASTGVRRADSLMKLSSKGRPRPVRSNSP